MEKRKAKAMPDVRVDGTITNEELRIRLAEGGISSDDESVVIATMITRSTSSLCSQLRLCKAKISFK